MNQTLQTETVYTYDEYKKFNHAILWQVRKIPVVMLVIELVLLAVCYFTRDITYIVCAVLVPLIFKIVFSINAKSDYAKNPSIQNVTFIYTFYPNYVEQASVLGKGRVNYSQVQRVLETPTHFYLVLGQGSGIIILKRKCSEELVSFLQELQAQKA